jgi:hypothetical protein
MDEFDEVFGPIDDQEERLKKAAEASKRSFALTLWVVSFGLGLLPLILNNRAVKIQAQKSQEVEHRKETDFRREIQSQQIQQRIIDDELESALRRGENPATALEDHRQKTKARARAAWLKND